MILDTATKLLLLRRERERREERENCVIIIHVSDAYPSSRSVTSVRQTDVEDSSTLTSSEKCRFA